MKLPELKKRFKNKYVIRIAAGVLTVAVAGGSVGAYTVQAEKSAKTKTETTQESDKDAEEDLEEILTSKVSNTESDATKEETVYVVADNTGKADTVIVSDWLKNPDGKDKLEDESDLKDIKNVKGKEKYEEKDGQIIWNAKGNDIYYQGTTEKELPVTQTITYYLDGEEMEPEEIAGKSGKVTIRFDYKNNQKTTVTVDGKKHSVYVPFTILTGMALDDSYSNVEVKNGKVISDGDKQFVAGVVMPGLRSSLNVKSSDFGGDIDIPEYIEVTADVKDFKLDMTMSVMMSGVATGDDVEDIVDLSDLDDAIDTLSDSSSQLVDGTNELSKGMNQLKAQLPTLINGVTALKIGSSQASSGANDLNDAYQGEGGVAVGAKNLKTGVNTLTSGLKGMLNTVSNSASDYSDAQKKLYENDEAANAAVQTAIKNYVASVIAYQNYGRGIMDIQTAIQGSLVSSKESLTSSVTEINTGLQNAGADALMIDASKLAVSDLGTYMSFNDKTGEYTLNDGLPQAVRTIAGQLETATGEINGKMGATANQVSGYLRNINTTVQNTAFKEQTIQLANGAAALNQIVGVEKAMASSLSSSKGSLSTYADQLDATIAQYNAASQSMQANYTNLTKAVTNVCTYYGTGGAAQALATIRDNLSEQGLTADALTQLENGVNDIEAAINGGTLSNGAKVETGLAEGTATLTAGLAQIDKGLASLNNATPTLSDGVTKLADGSNTLNEGMIKFDEEGIQKLADTYNGDVKGLMEKVAAVMKAGSNYQTFSDKTDDTVGEVKFIIRTEGVKEKED